MPEFTPEQDAVILALMKCGVSFQSIAREIGRTPGACWARSRRLRGLSVLPEGEGELINPRRCHDCGRPTADYRCRQCRLKWREKYGVGRDATEEEGL